MIYSREDETLYLLDGEGNGVDSWPAANNTTNPYGDPYEIGSNGPAPNGEWPINGPIVETGDSESYGPDFIPIGDAGDGDDRNDIARQRGLGIHGGREGKKDGKGRTGYEYNTLGCIRMGNSDLKELVELMETYSDDDPVDSIVILDGLFDIEYDMDLEASLDLDVDVLPLLQEEKSGSSR